MTAKMKRCGVHVSLLDLYKNRYYRHTVSLIGWGQCLTAQYFGEQVVDHRIVESQVLMIYILCGLDKSCHCLLPFCVCFCNSLCPVTLPHLWALLRRGNLLLVHLDEGLKRKLRQSQSQCYLLLSCYRGYFSLCSVLYCSVQCVKQAVSFQRGAEEGT